MAINLIDLLKSINIEDFLDLGEEHREYNKQLKEDIKSLTQFID